MSDDPPPEQPEFGPSGYLPERASKRARKIILRAPLGLQWVIGAVVLGGVLLAAGVWWLSTTGPPEAPYEPTIAFDATERVTAFEDIWILAGTDRVRAVANSQVDDLTWCDESRRLESGDGRVWSASGRGHGTPSLELHPATVYDGTVYVDRTQRRPGPTATEEATEPTC